MAPIRDWATEILGKPLGSRGSAEIDDAIREFKADLHERLEGILYDPNEFPWKIRIPGVEVDGYQSYSVPVVTAVGTLGTPTRGSFDVKPGAVGAGGAIGLGVPIVAPAGGTLVIAEMKGYRTHAGATVQMSVAELDSATETFTAVSVVSLDAVSADLQIKQSGLLNLPMTSDKSYYLSLFLQADASGVDTARISSVYYTVKLPGV